jgi:hypothetical protein
MIQRASEVLRDIADHRRELRRRLLADPKIISTLKGIRIILEGGVVGATLSKEAESLSIQLDDVLIGPINFD